MSGLINDFRLAVRSLRRTPTFTIVALLCLALGIGSTTAVFSVVQGVLLRPLPFADSDRLAALWATYDSQGAEGIQYFLSAQQFVEARDQSTTLEHFAATTNVTLNLGGDEEPERLAGVRASAELFPLLGITPIVGRTYTPDEDTEGNRIALISEDLWRRRFGANPEFVGSEIILDGEQFVLLGVLPSAPRYPAEIDIWIPLAVDDITGRARTRGRLNVLARLVPRTTAEAASGELASIAEGIVRAFPDRNIGLGLDTQSMQANLNQDIGPAIVVLLVAVAFLLAIAVANVANLLLVRAQAQAHEIAIRLALGATRRRLLRHLLVEHLVLGAAGGGMGLLIALWGLPLLLALRPTNITPYGSVGIDGTVLGFTAAITIGATLVFGLLPMIKSVRPNLSAVMKDGGGRSGIGRTSRRMQTALVVAEIATALVLSIGSGLMIKSFERATAADPGFNPAGVLTVRVSAPPEFAPVEPRQAAFFESIRERIQAVPGVDVVGAVHSLPATGTDIVYGFGFSVEGKPPEVTGQRHFGVGRVVTPGYLPAMQTTLVRGRQFVPADRDDARDVVIVSEALVRQHWSGEDPLGKRIKLGTYDSDNSWRTIVGIVADVREQGLNTQPQGGLYVPHLQFPRPYTATMVFAIRAAADPVELAPAVRAAIRRAAPGSLIFDVATLEDRLASSLEPQRFNATLFALFATLGLILAAAGVYGVVSYAVSQRSRELGLRAALGANKGHLTRLVLGIGMRMAAIGIGVGVVGAFFLTRLLQSVLFEVQSTDALTYVVVCAVLSGVTVLATILPARRATRADPAVVLRSD